LVFANPKTASPPALFVPLIPGIEAVPESPSYAGAIVVTPFLLQAEQRRAIRQPTDYSAAFGSFLIKTRAIDYHAGRMLLGAVRQRQKQALDNKTSDGVNRREIPGAGQCGLRAAEISFFVPK
jgi:hypothetical protein